MHELIGHLLAPLPLLAVLLGAFLVAWAQQGGAATGRAFAALGPLWRADPSADRDHARAVMLKVAEVAQLHGLAPTDRVRARNPFLAEAISQLANSRDADSFAGWANRILADREARHGEAIGVWNAVADAAPAMGMAGTIIGLIGMFAAMDDPAAIGPSMALALLTTFHGVVLANLVAAPIAVRLSRLDAAERGWQRELADRMVALARQESGPLRRKPMREVA
jgi:chemotaxis protein MotA